MRIAYVNVFVSDLARAVDFYRSKLGLALEQSDTGHGYASFAAVTVIDGAAEVWGGPGQDTVGVGAGESFLVPADRAFSVSGSQDENTVYLIASIA